MSDTRTVGFYGPADIKPELLAELLDQHLGEGDFDFLFPAKIARAERGLKLALSWVTEELGEDAFSTTDDLIAELQGASNPELILFVPEGDELPGNVEDILSKAVEAAIPAFDITQGLDDAGVKLELIEFDDAEDPAPEPEPAPKAKTPTKRTSSRSRAQKPSESVTDTPKRRGRPRKTDIQDDVAEAKAVKVDPKPVTVTATPPIPEGVPLNDDIETVVKRVLIQVLTDALNSIMGPPKH